LHGSNEHLRGTLIVVGHRFRFRHAAVLPPALQLDRAPAKARP
jgi:hypothetical protein